MIYVYTATWVTICYSVDIGQDFDYCNDFLETKEHPCFTEDLFIESLRTFLQITMTGVCLNAK